MTFEVLATETDVVSTRDIRDVPVDSGVVLVVVLLHGGRTLREEVHLGEIPGGPGTHRGLVCPRCSLAKYRLVATEVGLGCGPCSQRRSRRQLEHRSAAWCRLGGCLEDIVLRGLRPGRTQSTVPHGVRHAAQQLVEEDRERSAVLLLKADAAANLALMAIADSGTARKVRS